MPTPKKVEKNSKVVGGGGRIQKPSFFNESVTLKWNSWEGGGGFQFQKPSMGGV